MKTREYILANICFRYIEKINIIFQCSKFSLVVFAEIAILLYFFSADPSSAYEVDGVSEVAPRERVEAEVGGKPLKVFVVAKMSDGSCTKYCFDNRGFEITAINAATIKLDLFAEAIANWYIETKPSDPIVRFGCPNTNYPDTKVDAYCAKLKKELTFSLKSKGLELKLEPLLSQSREAI